MSTQTKDRLVSQGNDASQAPSTFARFVEQLEKRIREKTNHGAVCPMCTHDTWEIPNGELSIALRGWDGGRSGQVRAVPVICEHCGFIANFLINSYDL